MSYDIAVAELSAEDPVAAHPADINVVLKPHQLSLLYRCQQFENEQLPLSQFDGRLNGQHRTMSESDYLRTRVGILGDQVGSGKSFVVLSLVVTNVSVNTGPSLRSYGCSQIIVCKQDRIESIKTSLLVIPHNLCSQWAGYIEGFSPNLKYLMLNKSRLIHPLVMDTISHYDLVVVTSTFYNRIASMLTQKSIKMRRVIFDEVDDINIPSCAHVDSEFYWFVTASYGNLIYPRGYHKFDSNMQRCIWHATGVKNSGFIKNIFMDVRNNTDLIKILVLRNSPDFVQQSMRLPQMDVTNVLCKAPPSITILNGLVARQIIDALNGGDVTAALQHVNPANRTTEDCIIQALIDKFERQLHNFKARLELYEQLQYEEESEREVDMDRVRLQMSDVQRRITSIHERISTSNTCCICFEEMPNKCVVPCCSNSYCFECISRWLASGRAPACPMCKHVPLRVEDLMVVQPDGSGRHLLPPTIPREDDLSPAHDKLQNLEAILRRRQPGSKFLIFSSYDSSLSTIHPILTRLSIRFSSIKGNHAVIRNKVDSYKNGDLDVLLVNASQYGSGLNLENTTDIILFHRFNSEIEKQVIGRSQRYGRTQPLRVWYLLHDVEMNRNDDAAGASSSSSVAVAAAAAASSLLH